MLTLDLQRLITDRRTYRIMHDVHLSDKCAKAILDELVNRGWWLSYICCIKLHKVLVVIHESKSVLFQGA
jgi:hypothetical protein